MGLRLVVGRGGGFPLTEITGPTIIWQGGLDDVHTPAMANWLHATLPRSRLNYEPDYATFNFFDVIDDVLTSLTEFSPRFGASIADSYRTTPQTPENDEFAMSNAIAMTEAEPW